MIRSIDYQWFVDRVAVTGATSTTVHCQGVGPGQARIHVRGRRQLRQMISHPQTTLPRARTKPVLPGLPTITGRAQVGKTLTVDTSDDIGSERGSKVPEFTYQWLVGGEAVSTATAKTYTVMTERRGQEGGGAGEVHGWRRATEETADERGDGRGGGGGLPRTRRR